MGQQGSKSPIEARVIFQRVGTVDMYQRIGECCSTPSIVRIQKKVTSQSASPDSSPRPIEKSTTNSWSQSRGDTGGLVYVMDNPTGGVWVKPGEKWTRTWYTNETSIWNAHNSFDGIKWSTPCLDALPQAPSSSGQDASDFGSCVEGQCVERRWI